MLRNKRAHQASKVDARCRRWEMGCTLAHSRAGSLHLAGLIDHANHCSSQGAGNGLELCETSDHCWLPTSDFIVSFVICLSFVFLFRRNRLQCIVDKAAQAGTHCNVACGQYTPMAASFASLALPLDPLSQRSDSPTVMEVMM